MSRGQRPGPTADLVALLATGPKHRDELAAALNLPAFSITSKLLQRMHHRGDVSREGAVWSIRPLRAERLAAVQAKPAPAPQNESGAAFVQRLAAHIDAEAVAVARRTPDAAVRERAAREIVCEVATSRTYRAPGEYRPPRMVVREGAFDYLATPTRVGDRRLAYQGATNMSTTAIAAGARSGVK